eukprot:TRINITY_DN9895_c0_g2_i1.p1 TRINITY_DN9895_c0_g2~~TRINITY_DN9895_c0_g2_i1.p1  ORF type:complete len:256 (+),score=61.00 TRINITY_DN9895_c0_g2_i1:148-915(+)
MRDVETESIEVHFEAVRKYIDEALQGNAGEEGGRKGKGKVLIHCFEGRSRSAAVLLSYLMLSRHMSLASAWALLKAAHPRAQPNDGFMRTLVALDRKLHGGKASMEWRDRKPQARTCPVCAKTIGLSSDSLRAHLKSRHPGTLQRADGAPVVLLGATAEENSLMSPGSDQGMPLMGTGGKDPVGGVERRDGTASNGRGGREGGQAKVGSESNSSSKLSDEAARDMLVSSSAEDLPLDGEDAAQRVKLLKAIGGVA